MEKYWDYKLDPQFPFHIFQFVTQENHDKLHWHDYLQIGLCLEGTGKFVFSNKEYDVTQGDIFMVSNFENHVAYAEPEKSTTYLFMIFLPELIASPGSRLFDFEYLSPFWYDLKTFCNKIEQSQPIVKIIAEAMEEICTIWEQKKAGFKHQVEANLRRVLGMLVQYYQTTDSSYSTHKVTNRLKLQPVLNHINQHFRENILLEKVSSIIHMSESRFRHFFKEVTYIGFKEYIAYLRINEAKKLLVSTEMNISDLIHEIGYSNTYQFYKLFYKYVSMTPAEYRRLYGKKGNSKSFILENQ